MKYFGFILFIFFLFGCQNHPNKDKTYFGGEIINPKSDFVLLMQNEVVIDSIPIQPNNTFGKYFSTITEGLYSFKHGNEFQYLYLEPKDSISIRLNTWDFDETLVFDGIGSDKNELLLDLFLSNEKETSIFYSYFDLDEDAFESKIDEAYIRHAKRLKQFNKSNNLSDNYLHLAQGVIDYPIYKFKELYPFYHKKSFPKDSSFVLSTDYYNYRKNINLNDSLLSTYHGYQNFLTAHLYSLAYNKNASKAFDSNFREVLIQLIADRISLPKLKNRLLYQEINNLLFNTSDKLDSKLFDVFFDNVTDTIAIKAVKQILSAKELMVESQQFINFDVVSFRHDKLSIKNLINEKNAVVCFISSEIAATDYLAARMRYLEAKFPQLTFVGIYPSNLNDDQKTFENKLTNQYIKANNKGNNLLFSSTHPRVVLINKRGNVVDNYTLLNTRKFEIQLQSLLKSNK